MKKAILFYVAISLSLGHVMAQLSRVHVKAPVGSTWGISSEAATNKKLVGFSHDGTAATISTGTADGSAQSSPLKFATGNLVRMSILENGFIGIGTATPSAELTVAGKILGREVRVNIDAGKAPDYVFQTNYELPSLAYVAGYINQHRHLPEVPSAVEMEKDGINVGEMNMLLLKKVEELTLYLLMQDQQIKDVNAKLKALQEELNSCK